MKTLRRLKRLWDMTDESDILVVKPSAMTQEEAIKLGKMTGKVIVYSENPQSVKKADILSTDLEGDGKAEFFGDPTEQEQLDFEREENGTKRWYDRLKNLDFS